MNIKASSVPRSFVFVTGRILRNERYVFLAHNASSLDKGNYRAHVLACDKGEWQDLATFEWQAVDLVVAKVNPLTILVVGRDGQVGILEGGGQREDKIDEKRPVGPMRGIEKIGAEIYVYGMKREVYRRLDNAGWERYDKGMQTALPKGKIDISALIKQRMRDLGGINSIAGTPGGAVHAFGMRGEIWHLQKDRWLKTDSPTNLMLTDSTVGDDGTFTVCGHVGVVINGSMNNWRLVEYSGPSKLDFCALSIFKGTIYLADGHSLRALRRNSLEIADFGTGEIVPCSSLHSDHGLLLSVAGKELFVTGDGEHWISLLPDV